MIRCGKRLLKKLLLCLTTGITTFFPTKVVGIRGDRAGWSEQIFQSRETTFHKWMQWWMEWWVRWDGELISVQPILVTLITTTTISITSHPTQCNQVTGECRWVTLSKLYTNHKYITQMETSALTLSYSRTAPPTTITGMRPQ